MEDTKALNRVHTQPDRINFGSNYTGAKVWGSFQVIPATSCENVRSMMCGPESCNANPLPDWLELQEPFPTGQKGLAWRFRVNTDTPGNFLAPFAAECDTGMGRCQIGVELRDGQPALGDAIFCDSPFHCYASGDNLEPVTRVLSALDFRHHYVDRLADVSAIRPRTVLLHCTGLCSARSDDVELLLSWVENGTNIVVLADEFYRGTTAAANRILEHFDMKMLQDGTDDPNATREEKIRRLMDWQERYTELISEETDITAHPLTEGIGRLHWFRPCPVVCTGPKSQPLVLNPNDRNECFAAVSQPKGYVVAVGRSLLVSLAGDGWPYDNDRFLANLLVGGDAESVSRCN